MSPAHTTITAQQRPVHVSAATPGGPAGFARYTIGEEIGRGGLGAVREAEDLLLRRELAIKTLLRPDASAMSSFVEEAQITGQLEHPNIVPVHELGFDPDGRPYLAMKRVRGTTLREEIAASFERKQATEAEQQADLRRLLEILVKVCDGVGYAHSRGVIHRDLKPDNVMVGEFGEVLVMDWGLARPGVWAAGDAGDERPQPGANRNVISDRREAVRDLTVEGDVFGTPAYMAPEQAAGRVSEIGPASDIYALGAILYAILVGEAPFSGQSFQILAQVSTGKLVPPSRRNATRHVPRELEALTLRAMALNPADRYATAAELRDDIQRFLSGRTLTAADYTSWQLLSKWARRHKVAVVGALSTAAAIIIGLVGIIVSRDAARQAELDRLTQDAMVHAQAAHDALPAAHMLRFNPASPQDYYRAWLPLMLRLGQAIQTHPDPPPEWKSELATYCADVQDRATSIADWGMATHVAMSAGAWKALDPAASEAAVQAVEAERQKRIAEDVGRLQVVLDRIGSLETGTPPEGGSRSYNSRRLVPSEFEERAMRMVAHVRKDTGPLTGTIMRLLRGEPDTCQSMGLSGKPHWLQQHFLLELLGRLRNPYTEVDGQTAADMAADVLRKPYDTTTNEEDARWAQTAAYLDCAAGAPVSQKLGEPVIGYLRRKLRDNPSMALGDSLARAMAVGLRGVEVLDKQESIGAMSSTLAYVVDWVVTSAGSGSDFTREVLDRLDPADGSRSRLLKTQSLVLLDVLGRWGDALPPDVNRPDRCAPTVLIRELDAIPEDAIVNDPAMRGGFTADRLHLCARASVIARSISRLGRNELAPALYRLMWEAGPQTPFYRECEATVALMPIEPWATDTPDQALALAMALRTRARFAEADAWLQTSTARWPDDSRLWRALAGVRMAAYSGDALTPARKAVALAPDDCKALTVLGLLRCDSRQPRRARRVGQPLDAAADPPSRSGRRNARSG